MYKMITGAAFAVLFAMVLADGTVLGIEAWKLLLAAIGFVIFRFGSRSSIQSSSQSSEHTRPRKP